MIIIAGYSLVNEDDRDRFVAAHQDLVVRARQFAGCLDVAISADPSDPRRINALEVWRDVAALDGWRAVANAPEMDIDINIDNMKRYDAEDGGPLF